ncbi:MAG TPA: hypothetical protein VHG32_09165 [Thermoanaerobaculia bacterium]|jgi:hypothetical protein|nr:hypothetical protein [Thermoanaerobaculia bacterium]
MDPKSGRRVLATAMVFAALAASLCWLPAAVAQTKDPLPLQLSPALPAEGDAIVVAGSFLAYNPFIIIPTSVQVQGSQITLNANVLVGPPIPPNLGPVIWTLPALPAGAYTMSLSLQGIPGLRFTVRPRTALVRLVAGRFQVAVADQEPGVVPSGAQLSDAAGYFWFFDPTNVEITTKVIDGRAVNGHYWVFVASMTDTPFTVTVTDTQAASCGGGATCPSRTYTNPPHTNQNFIDVAAF